MAITKKKKAEILDKHKRSAGDTGSAEIQVALFTERINYLTEHFKQNKKDHHSRVGLIRLVTKRRKLLGYLKKQNAERYKQIIRELNLRK